MTVSKPASMVLVPESRIGFKTVQEEPNLRQVSYV